MERNDDISCNNSCCSFLEKEDGGKWIEDRSVKERENVYNLSPRLAQFNETSSREFSKCYMIGKSIISLHVIGKNFHN